MIETKRKLTLTHENINKNITSWNIWQDRMKKKKRVRFVLFINKNRELFRICKREMWSSAEWNWYSEDESDNTHQADMRVCLPLCVQLDTSRQKK